MGWEDTWLPELGRSLTEPGFQVRPDLVRPLTHPGRLPQETRNHRAGRATLAYRVDPRGVGRQLILEELRAHQTDWMGHELASPVYSPFYETAFGAALLTAHQLGDTTVIRLARAWWESWRALMAWQSVPPAPGLARERRRGQPELVEWDPVPVSLRANRPHNAAAGHQLRQLTGLETPQDRRVIRGSVGSINAQQLWIVARLLEVGALEVRTLDLEDLRAYLPALAHPVHVERWDDGYQAWAPRLHGLGPAQLAVRVERGKVVQLERSRKTARALDWESAWSPEPVRGARRVVIGGESSGLTVRRVRQPDA